MAGGAFTAIACWRRRARGGGWRLRGRWSSGLGTQEARAGAAELDCSGQTGAPTRLDLSSEDLLRRMLCAQNTVDRLCRRPLPPPA